MPNFNQGRATNPLVHMSTSVTEFVPGGAPFKPANATAPFNPTAAAQASLSVNTKEFVPSGGAAKQGMNSQAPTF